MSMSPYAQGGSDEASPSELDRLVSESRNPATTDIDLMSSREIVATINAEDRLVAAAVEAVLPEIALAVDRIVEAFHNGGRLIYVGAGTSGRLGVLDASECPPTFSVPADLVIGLMAGGTEATYRSIEDAEDDPAAGAQDLRSANLSGKDVVVGIAASGRTPYVVGALHYARQVGATTVALSCNPGSMIAGMADIAISPVVGPEVLTGSTRMKSGTAQKMVLNMLTTASMIRLGKTYQNLMVDLDPGNGKLLARAIRTVMQTTNCSEADAKTALAETGNEVKLAILIRLTGLDLNAAKDALERAGGYLRRAVQDNN